MIDGNNTTDDWQAHTGKVCVWGVGSFEQHSVHLPLATDGIEADYFARFIATELDAALLPVLPFGTCLEMTGFRGSLTLHPETLMQVVRDVADEMERQGFAILVLVNGHGGNYCLSPVVRDVNRADRSIKILQVNFWEFCDPELYPDASQGPNFHAAEWETSLMLALRPDLVGDGRADIQRPADEQHPLRQQDLNTFGVGHFNPDGAVGSPSLATKEQGDKILESLKTRMIPHVRDRIDRLERDPRYGGPWDQGPRHAR